MLQGSFALSDKRSGATGCISNCPSSYFFLCKQPEQHQTSLRDIWLDQMPIPSPRGALFNHLSKTVASRPPPVPPYLGHTPGDGGCCLPHSDAHLQTPCTSGGYPALTSVLESSVGLGFPFPPPHTFSHRANSSSHPSWSQTSPQTHPSGVATTYQAWHCGDRHRDCSRLAGTPLTEMGRCFVGRMGSQLMTRSCWGGAAPCCLSATTTRVLGALQKIA